MICETSTQDLAFRMTGTAFMGSNASGAGSNPALFLGHTEQMNMLFADRHVKSMRPLATMKKLKSTPGQFKAYAIASLALTLSGFAFGSACHGQVSVQTPANLTASVPADAPAASEINAFQAADRKRMPPLGAVLFIGSSSIRMWDTLAQDFPDIPVINRGFGGSLIQESTRYADRIVIPYKPKMIVFCAGTNDLAYGNKNPQQVFQDYKDFVAKVHTALPDTRIIYLSINPTVARWNQEGEILDTNHLIEKFDIETNSKAEKLNFINAHSQLLTADGQPPAGLLRADHLHFNRDGYKAWTAIVKPRIMALAAIDGVVRVDMPKPQ